MALSLTSVAESYANRTYRIRAVNAAGPSTHASASGYRDVGNPTGYRIHAHFMVPVEAGIMRSAQLGIRYTF